MIINIVLSYWETEYYERSLERIINGLVVVVVAVPAVVSVVVVVVILVVWWWCNVRRVGE
jgi:hypothetical protein